MIDEQMPRIEVSLPRVHFSSIKIHTAYEDAETKRLHVRYERIVSNNLTRHVASIRVPFVQLVASAICVEPGLQEASVAVSDQHLAAHHGVAHCLEADAHLKSTIAIQRVDDIHIVVQVDAAILHHDHDTPKIASI